MLITMISQFSLSEKDSLLKIFCQFDQMQRRTPPPTGAPCLPCAWNRSRSSPLGDSYLYHRPHQVVHKLFHLLHISCSIRFILQWFCYLNWMIVKILTWRHTASSVIFISRQPALWSYLVLYLTWKFHFTKCYRQQKQNIVTYIQNTSMRQTVVGCWLI